MHPKYFFSTHYTAFCLVLVTFTISRTVASHRGRDFSHHVGLADPRGGAHGSSQRSFRNNVHGLNNLFISPTRVKTLHVAHALDAPKKKWGKRYQGYFSLKAMPFEHLGIPRKCSLHSNLFACDTFLFTLTSPSRTSS